MFNQSFRSSPNLAAAAEAAALAVIRPVEAKYPALLFKQQLAAYVEKIFGMIRDNLKKELSALISMCIQVSLTSLFAAIYFCPDFTLLYPNAVTTRLLRCTLIINVFYYCNKSCSVKTLNFRHREFQKEGYKDLLDLLEKILLLFTGRALLMVSIRCLPY